MVVHDVVSQIAGTDDQDIGLVTQAIGGICTVHTRAGEVIQCRPRGRIKKEGLRVLPGDVVRFSDLDDGEGVVEEVLPRRSLLKRPYIANVDQVVIVVALAEPTPNLDLLDRLLVAADDQGLSAMIVWNKADLVTPGQADVFERTYAKAGFTTVRTSRKKNQGLGELLAGLGGHLTVLTGASGVGKSSLLNWLFQDERFETGSISTKLQRGRHTTRSVELVPMPKSGWIADSPGFSVLDLTDMPKERLSSAYPEMELLKDECKFSGCLHRTEPGCRVRAAMGEGRIDRGRYERYLRLVAELEEIERRKYQ